MIQARGVSIRATAVAGQPCPLPPNDNNKIQSGIANGCPPYEHQSKQPILCFAPCTNCFVNSSPTRQLNSQYIFSMCCSLTSEIFLWVHTLPSLQQANMYSKREKGAPQGDAAALDTPSWIRRWEDFPIGYRCNRVSGSESRELPTHLPNDQTQPLSSQG